MSEQIYLHVGAMKTGTSFLQGVLTYNAEPLLGAGLLVAPNRGGAVEDLITSSAAGEPRREEVRGAWAGLVDAARSFDGRATVLSHEFLGLQGPGRANRIVEDFAGLDLHILMTVRDAAGVLPAQWQTAARNRGSQTWPQYVAAARDERTRPRSHTFLRSQRIGTLIRLWRTRVGPDHVHVVTVPRPGAPREALWERFASVLQVDPAVATDLTVESNPSTGYATAHLMCLAHAEAARRGLPKREVQRLAGFVAYQAAMRRDEDTAPPLDGPTLQFTADWNRRALKVIRRNGVRLVGEEADLPVEPDLSRERPLLPPDDDSLVSATHGALAALSTMADGVRPAAGSSIGVAADAAVSTAVDAVVDAMATVIAADGTARLNRRGTALVEDA